MPITIALPEKFNSSPSWDAATPIVVILSQQLKDISEWVNFIDSVKTFEMSRHTEISNTFNTFYPAPITCLIFLIFGWIQPNGMMAQDTYAEKRQRMVSEQIEKRGVKDRAVLEAMRQVPRHLFIPKSRWPMAYADQAVYIGHGQTISQPYIVAFMTEALQLTPSSRVLEIGTGSGYQAAVLAELVDTVHTIEIVEELAKRAEETLRSEGYANVFVKHGDGNYGWKEHAPYDAIIATAAAEEIPKALMEQLNDPGRMIIPVGDAGSIQYLVMLKKEKGKISREKLLPVRFVPFVK